MLAQVRSSVRALWRLPAPADARTATPLERVLVAVVGVVAVVEVAVLDADLPWRWLSLAGFLVWLPTLLVRRTRPLLTVVVFAVVTTLLAVAGGLTDGPPPGDLDTGVVALLVPYSLARWAGGQDAVRGLLVFLAIATTSLTAQGDLTVADRIGGAAVVVASIAVGAALRARSMLHGRRLDDVRRDERERLARDLHDTVAHHLTAIAISAQAGLAVADRNPDAAKDALRRIDEEASRTLAETRSVVRALRTEETPSRPLDDLAGLAAPGGPGPAVQVTLADHLDLPPTVSAALHRIAQEAVANARRHAVGATTVRVDVRRRLDLVELTVTDDGRATAAEGPGTGSAPGYGLVGMDERAELLGGRLAAGPAEGGGWRVHALLPVDLR